MRNAALYRVLIRFDENCTLQLKRSSSWRLAVIFAHLSRKKLALKKLKCFRRAKSIMAFPLWDYIPLRYVFGKLRKRCRFRQIVRTKAAAGISSDLSYYLKTWLDFLHIRKRKRLQWRPQIMETSIFLGEKQLFES